MNYELFCIFADKTLIYMKRLLIAALIMLPMTALASHHILSPSVKSLQVIVNDDWTALPVLQLGSRDVLTIGFDELSHNYHRYVYRLEPCNPDWTPCDDIFESDWLVGFNSQPIEDYENSLNTNVLYTHYQFQIPNEQTSLKLSGNYRLYIEDEDEGNEAVAIVEFRVVEPVVNVGIGVSTNTDIDFKSSHQQVSMTVNYNSLRVTNPEEQIQTFVMQNGREDNMKVNVRPNYVNQRGLQWEHNRQLIFEAGNEYHKFEALDPTHITMGLGYVTWDQDEHRYHAFPYFCEPRRNYLYDEDANGAFLLRNSDDYEAERLSEYIYIHYKVKDVPQYDHARVFIEGRWTSEAPDTYTMTYDEEDRSYNAVILQKLGYYNYQILMQDLDGTTHRLPEEGSFYQTENKYQAFVYYKGTGARTWRLVGYQEIKFRDQ